MRSAWPVAAELTTYATGMGVTVPTGAVLADYVASAIAEWEDVTGWRPFLGATSSTTRAYTPPDGYLLDLRGGFTSITAIRVGVSASSTGTLLVESTDYWLWPEDAVVGRRPYWGVKFAAAQFGQPNSITVAGKRGYYPSIDEDAYMAVLKRAMSIVISHSVGAVGAATKIEQGPVKFTMAPGKSAMETLDGEFYAAAMRYKRFEA